MKFIHTADWHLGKLFYGEYLTENQEWILKNRFLPILDEEKPDAVILAGDVYDRSVPPAEAVMLFDEMISEIVGKRHLPFLVISGNHDSAERISFAGSILKNSGLYIYGDLKRTEPVILKDEYGEVAFVPLPYAEPGKVREALAVDVHTHEEAELALSHFLLEKIPHVQRKIAIAHEFVAGGKESDSERPLSIGGTDQIHGYVFDGYDYTALGHLHGPQKAGGSDKIRYSGSLLKYSFSEATQKKGIIVGNIDGNGKVETKFVHMKPLHDVRIIRGTFEELMKAEDPCPDDFLMAELTDERPVIDGMARLRTKYPNMMTIRSLRKISTDSGNRNFNLAKKVDVLDMFRVFYKEFQEKEWTAEEETYMKKIWEELQKEDL